MPWTYDQSSGELRDPSGQPAGRGYAGKKGPARNNRAYERVVAVGPLPVGGYRIGPAHTSRRTGPVAMNLTPVGHAAYGRSAFQIHGDNARNDASSGCIIFARPIRDRIAASPDRMLLVVA